MFRDEIPGFVSYGFLDKDGKKVGDSYSAVNNFSKDGYCLVKKSHETNHYTIIDNNFNDIKNTTSKIILGDSIEKGLFNEGFMAIIDENGPNFIDKNGDYINKFIERNLLYDFKNSMAKVAIPPEPDSTKTRFTFMDTSGNILDRKYDFAQNFNEFGLAPVKLKDRQGYYYIDKKGTTVAGPFYDYYNFNSLGFCQLKTLDQKQNKILFQDGRVFNAPDNIFKIKTTNNNLIEFNLIKPDSYLLFDKNGNLLSIETYGLTEANEGWAIVSLLKTDAKNYNFKNINDKEFEDSITVSTFINGKGEMLDYCFIKLDPFKNGMACGNIGFRYYAIDSTGKVYYDKPLKHSFVFYNDMAVIRNNEGYCLMDKNLNLQKNTFKYIYPFVPGSTVTSAENFDSTYCLIDKDSNPVSQNFADLSIHHDQPDIFTACIQVKEKENDKFVVDKYFYCNAKGENICNEYFDIKPPYFREGLVVVPVDESNMKLYFKKDDNVSVSTEPSEPKFTFMDTKGKIGKFPLFKTAEQFNDGFAVVSFDDFQYRYIDKNGNFLRESMFSMVNERNATLKQNRLEKLSSDSEVLDTSLTPMTDTEKIKNWIDSGESVLLRGPSGIGKTERIKSLYPDAIYIKLTNNMFPEKVVGSINLQTGENIPPAFAKELLLKYATKEEKEKIAQNVQYLYDCADEIYERSKNSSSKSVILLDELLNVKPAIQSLVYNIVLNKVVEAGSGLKLPANTVVVATGNQKKYSQVAEDLAEPLEKRFDHILDMEPKVNEWIQEYAIPNNIHPTVVGYLLCKYQENNKSENLDKIGYFYEEPDVAEKHLDKNGCKGKTNDPRGWASISRSLYNFEKNLKDGKYIGKDVESILKTSLDTKLRDEWSGDFFDFYNNPTLSPQDIVDKNYTDDDIPTSINDKFATVYGLLNSTEEQIPTVKKFIKKHCSKEYLTLFEEFLSEKNNIENTSNDTTNLELDTDSPLSTESEMTN